MGKIKTIVEFTPEAIEQAVANLHRTLGPHPLEVRCIGYLNTIINPTERARVGHLLFGERYGPDIAPRCTPFPD